MRPLIVMALLLACSRPPARVALVPVVADCGAETVRASGLVLPPSRVLTAAHAARCPDGAAPRSLRAGAVVVSVESTVGDQATLVAQGEPWRGLPAPRSRALVHGDSGAPLLDADGAVICLVEDLIGDAYYRCVPVGGVAEAPPGLSPEDMAAPAGPNECWPLCAVSP